MSTKPYLLNNLLGHAPIDWEQAKKDYNIAGFEPEKLQFRQRDEVMQSLVTVTEQPALERVVWKQFLPPEAPAEAKELKNLARAYIVLANKDARLPKFSKWVSSMFSSNNQLMAQLSKSGQSGGNNEIIISCNPVDILRGADSRHFWSCLGGDGGFRTVLSRVVTKCSGVAVAYIDNPGDGKMQCRVWLNHGIVKGKDVIVMLGPYGNGFSSEQIADLIASKGYDVYRAGHGDVPFKLINTFDTEGEDRGVHWDILEGRQRGKLIAQAKCEPNIHKVVRKIAA